MSTFPTAIEAGSAAASVGVTALTSAATAAWAVPVIGAAAAGVLIAWAHFKKRGAQKEAATGIVDDLEKLLAENLAAYQDGPRTGQSQAAALAMFDDAITWLQSREACGNRDLGAAGERCISERIRGGRFDWYAAYRDPIAHDKTPTTTKAAGMFFSQGNLPNSDALPWLIPAALVLLALTL